MHTSVTQPPAGRKHRRHSPEFRAAVVQACLQPGVSIAAVALANDLNANLVRKWIIDARSRALSASADVPHPRAVAASDCRSRPVPTFVPLALPAPSEAAAGIQIDLCMPSGVTIKMTWPTSAADQCAAWLGEWLR